MRILVINIVLILSINMPGIFYAQGVSNPLLKDASSAQWVVREIDQLGVLPEPFFIKFNDGCYFSFYSDCNEHVGEYEISGNEIRFKYLHSSSVNCRSNTGMRDILTGTLEEVNNYMIEQNILYLRKDSKVMVSLTGYMPVL